MPGDIIEQYEDTVERLVKYFIEERAEHRYERY